MKKFVPFLILCFLSLPVFAQFTAVSTVNATGASGSYKTGYTQATTGRTDGDIVVGDASSVVATRGYAVFDLAGVLPPGSTVDSVYLRFNYTTPNTTLYVHCHIYGFASDLSTVTTPSTLFADAATGPSFSDTNWGASITGAQDTIALNNSAISFVQGALGNKISIGFVTDTPGNTYFITGEGGTAATQPRLIIKYHCTGVSGVAASATPDPVCQGSTFTLHGAGTGGSTYAWSGPSSYSSTRQNPTGSIIAADTTSGIYHYTLYNASGCPTSAITYVIMNPLPALIHGPTSVCASGTITLTDSTSLGTWSISPSSVGSISSSGVFTPSYDTLSTTVVTVTYALATGCSRSYTVTVHPLPGLIYGNAGLCSGTTSTLTDLSTPGSWSITPTSVATVSSGGVLHAGTFYGLNTNSAVVTYTLPTGCNRSENVIVFPQPGLISGDSLLCAPTSTTLTDTSAGTWSSSPTSVASVDPATGVVTGAAYGIATIKYTNGYGCFVSYPMHVATTAPAPITGVPVVCPILTTTLAESVPGGFWQAGSANASVNNGVVLGLSAGTAPISYYNGCGLATVNVTVKIPPAHMTGVFNTCVNSTTTLSDVTTPGIWTGSNGSIAAVAAGFGTVTGVSSGSLLITYTNPSTGCIDTANFTVYPLPQPITADSLNTCPGATTHLYDLTAGGTWSAHDLSVATVASNGVVTGVSASSTIITYSLGTGCYAVTGVLVNPNPAPIQGINPVCETLYDTVSDPTVGGVWSITPASVATINAYAPPYASIHGIGGGSATVAYTLSTGCKATAVEVIHATPSPALTYSGVTNTITTGSYYVTYQWYKDGVLVPGATTWSIAGITNGSYTVFVTDTFGCQVLSNPYNMVLAGVPVVNTAAQVQIFPNPATSMVNVECPVEVRAIISGMDGKNIIDVRNARNIDISALSTGIYIISIFDEAGNRLTVQKLIKE